MNTFDIDRSGLQPQTYCLSNGHPICLFPDPSLEMVKIDFSFPAGTNYQEKLIQSAAANTLFSEGTKSHSAMEIAEFLDFRGIVLEKNTDEVMASVSVYVLRKYVSELLPLLKEMFLEPAFLPEEYDVFIAKRKQVIQANLQKTAYVARNLFYEQLFPQGHPYGRYARPEDCEKLCVEDVRRFFNQRYDLSQAQIIVSGACDEAVLQNFETAFGNLPFEKEFKLSEVSPILESANTFPITMGIPNAVQSTLRLGRFLPFTWDSMDYGYFHILNTILGGYFGSRLMSNVREDKGYTYGINSRTMMYSDSIAFFITTDVGADVTQPALDEIYKEMRILSQQPVPEDELEIVKQFMMGDFLRSIDGIFERSERFKQMVAINVTEQFADNYFEALRTVTPEILMSLAQRLFQPEDLLQVVVGPMK